MRIELRFFASVREALGVANETAEVPGEVQTLGDVRTWLRGRGGVWAEVLREQRVLRMACDHEMSDPSTPISEGCEVAFFPPVTGG
jgi:molybdopterin synthase sulfur carrier subunit